MKCYRCGAQCSDGFFRCPTCGADLTASRSAPKPQAPAPRQQYNYQSQYDYRPQYDYQSQPDRRAQNVQRSQQVSYESRGDGSVSDIPGLIFGIIGLILSHMFILVLIKRTYIIVALVLTLIGIIFCGVAKGRRTAYRKSHGKLSGAASTGSALATPGLIVGIIAAVVLTVLLLVQAAALSFLANLFR